MKMTRIATMTVLVLSVITMGACKKTVYQQVNQVYSTVYTIKTTDWQVYTGADKIFQYYVNLSVPEIDDQIVANGGVVTYLSFDQGTPANYDALPETIAGYSYNALHAKGSLIIGYSTTDGSAASLPSGAIYAKVVILDGQPLD